MVKFMWNGIKVDGKLYTARYRLASPGIHVGCIYIMAKKYKDFPVVPGLTVTNDSDSMTDYFCKDEILVSPASPYFPDVLQAALQADAHNSLTWARRTAKYDAIFAAKAYSR